jgi:thiol:disulfide interchange protein DsbD
VLAAASSLGEQHLLTLVTMFGAGLATSLTPCVYPMIPITAGLLGGAGAGEGSRRQMVVKTLLYVTGLALVYATLGLVAGLTGSLFGSINSSPWALLLTGNLLLVAALAMLDVMPVRLPGPVAAWAGSVGGRTRGGVFLMGAVSGLVAAPCGAPAFAAALTWVSAEGSAVWGFLYLFVFSLGMTALLVAVGLFSGLSARLPRAGAWTLWIKRAAGGVLLLMAEYYFVQAGKVL